MRARTKKHHTKQDHVIPEEDLSISADDFLKEAYGDFPKWAVALSGLRYREGLTQKQLGEMIGVKQSNISLMERGRREIGKNIARRLGDLFKIDYRIFL